MRQENLLKPKSRKQQQPLQPNNHSKLLKQPMLLKEITQMSKRLSMRRPELEQEELL